MSLDKIKSLTETLVRVEENLQQERDILEFILEHTTDGYWDWNIQNGYEYLSPKFKSQLGYSVDEMENKPEAWMKICNKEDLKRAEQKITDVFEGNAEEFSERLRFTHKNGSEILILCRGKLVQRCEDGSPCRMIGTHHILDI